MLEEENLRVFLPKSGQKVSIPANRAILRGLHLLLQQRVSCARWIYVPASAGLAN